MQVESAWTVCKISATLSWLEVHVHVVLILYIYCLLEFNVMGNIWLGTLVYMQEGPNILIKLMYVFPTLTILYYYIILQEFKDLYEVLYSCYRRSLCYPLYRHWRLTETIFKDTMLIFKQGMKIKCLIFTTQQISQNLSLQYNQNIFYCLIFSIYLVIFHITFRKEEYIKMSYISTPTIKWIRALLHYE